MRGASGTCRLIITPTSTFNGTIERAEMYEYVLTNYKSINLTGGGDFTHPALVREGDLYIACGSYMNIINLADD